MIGTSSYKYCLSKEYQYSHRTTLKDLQNPSKLVIYAYIQDKNLQKKGKRLIKKMIERKTIMTDNNWNKEIF